jgi:hypothetical protein
MFMLPEKTQALQELLDES